MSYLYAEEFDAEQQIDLEEWIASKVFDAEINEESAAQLGRDILLYVTQHLRPDLIA